MQFLGNKQTNGLTYDFVCGVAENPRGRLVPADDAAIQVHTDHRVVRGSHDRSQLSMRVECRLCGPMVDVARRSVGRFFQISGSPSSEPVPQVDYYNLIAWVPYLIRYTDGDKIRASFESLHGLFITLIRLPGRWLQCPPTS